MKLLCRTSNISLGELTLFLSCEYVAAILFESESNKQLDAVIGVSAPFKLRLTRVMKRDKVDRIAVLARMDKQMPESEKLKLADFLIYNNGESLIDQVMKLHHTILELV